MNEQTSLHTVSLMQRLHENVWRGTPVIFHLHHVTYSHTKFPNSPYPSPYISLAFLLLIN